MRFILNYINNGFERNESMNVYYSNELFSHSSLIQSFSFCTKYKYNTTSALSCCKIDKKRFYTILHSYELYSKNRMIN